jgi:phenylacetate-CoA ligase
MLDRRLRLRRPPRMVVSASETLRPKYREVMEKAFDAPTTELYGMGEGVGGYARCELGGFHLDFENGIVELLPVEGGDPDVRRVVMTGLRNTAMPLIRYDSGDLARISRAACGCGRASPCIDSIDGRTEDFICTPDGRRVVGVNQIFKWATHLREAQVVQRRSDAVEVRMVVEPGYDEREEEVLRREFRDRLGPRVAVTFTRVVSIARSTNGKMRAVIVEPPAIPG